MVRILVAGGMIAAAVICFESVTPLVNCPTTTPESITSPLPPACECSVVAPPSVRSTHSADAALTGVYPSAACLELNVDQSVPDSAPVTPADARPRDKACPTSDKPLAVPMVTAA